MSAQIANQKPNIASKIGMRCLIEGLGDSEAVNYELENPFCTIK